MKTLPGLFLALTIALGSPLVVAQENRPPDGDRRHEGRGDHRSDDRNRPDNHFRAPMPPPQPTRYLGVVTTPLPPPLSAQLGLAEGFGLLVSDVLPDSPAAKAGVEKWDVLTKFNDQQLVDAGQLATLVRSQAKDADATLTVLRKGKEQIISIKIGERLMSNHMMPGREGPWHQMLPPGGPWTQNLDPTRERSRELGEKLRELQKRLQEYQERMKQWQKNPSSEMPAPPKVPEFGAPMAVPPLPPVDILREVRPGGVAQIRVLKKDGAVAYDAAGARLLLKDDTGEVEISTRDGKRVLVAKNPEGATIFDGPIDTEEQRAALPEKVREKLKQIDVRTEIAPFDAPPVPGAALDRGVQ